MNKQKGEKKAEAFLTGIVNMIVESNSDGMDGTLLGAGLRTSGLPGDR